MTSVLHKLGPLTPQRLSSSLGWRWNTTRRNVKLATRWRGHKPRVYVHPEQPNPIWRTYVTHPPLRYAPYPIAQVCHWVSSIAVPMPLPHLGALNHIYEVEHPLILAEQINKHRDGRIMCDWYRLLSEADEVNRLVAHPSCKIVLTFSGGLVKHFKQFLAPELWHKLDYAYPAYPTQAETEEDATSTEDGDKPFTILVIASRWSDKGVPEALRALEILRARHGDRVRMTLVSQAVPSGTVLPEGVEHYDVPLMSPQLKARLYRAADALLLPNYGETAACFPEAYAFGVPVVTTRIHHDKEFVREGQTGYLIETPIYAFSQGFGRRWKTSEEFIADLDARRDRGELETVVEQTVAHLETLMARSDTTEMKRACRAFHAELFSPQARNRQLRALYHAASPSS